MCLNQTTPNSNDSVAISTAIRGCETLTHWISRLKAKEAILKNNRESDLRKEVLLSKAAQRAQEQLELQQRLNRQRWTQVKAKELEKCGFCSALKRFCCCSNNPTSTFMEDDSEESKKIDEFFESLNSGKKRRQPSILKQNCKRVKAC
jgi:hypothetical protein